MIVNVCGCRSEDAIMDTASFLGAAVSIERAKLINSLKRNGTWQKNQ
jgi:hypothetical protein